MGNSFAGDWCLLAGKAAAGATKKGFRRTQLRTPEPFAIKFLIITGADRSSGFRISQGETAFPPG
jgi:hypothetical protein